MSGNLGSVDRFFRILLGMGGFVAVFAGQSLFWAGAGAMLIATGVLGYCPVYELLGLKDSKL